MLSLNHLNSYTIFKHNFYLNITEFDWNTFGVEGNFYYFLLIMDGNVATQVLELILTVNKSKDLKIKEPKSAGHYL